MKLEDAKHLIEQHKVELDLSALGITFATLTELLPAATAWLSFIWILIRIWETETVQGMRKKKP